LYFHYVCLVLGPLLRENDSQCYNRVMINRPYCLMTDSYVSNQRTIYNGWRDRQTDRETGGHDNYYAIRVCCTCVAREKLKERRLHTGGLPVATNVLCLSWHVGVAVGSRSTWRMKMTRRNGQFVNSAMRWLVNAPRCTKKSKKVFKEIHGYKGIDIWSFVVGLQSMSQRKC